MLVIARNNHIVVPCVSTNTTAVHKAMPIASTLSPYLGSEHTNMVFAFSLALLSLLVGAEFRVQCTKLPFRLVLI